MSYLLYFFIVSFSNTVGAISGMGGGVIIKPSLDFIGLHPLNEINFFASVAVFTMAIVSIIKQIKQGFKIEIKLAILTSIGSVLGGVLGNQTFYQLYSILSPSDVKNIQIILTVFLLIFVLVYTNVNIKNLQLKHSVFYVLVGFSLGYLSTLLGIGGGPINVSLLMLMFNLSIKESVVYSIIIIFFSQISKISIILLSLEFIKYDLFTLLFIIPSAIIGGYLGAILNKKLKEKTVLVVFQIICVTVMILNIINFFR